MAKAVHKSGKDDLLIDGLIDVGGLRLDVGHRHSPVGFAHDLADGGDVAERVAVGAQGERHLPHLAKGQLRVRHVHNRRDLSLEWTVSSVAGDADNFQIQSMPRPNSTLMCRPTGSSSPK